MLLWIEGFEGYKTTGYMSTALASRRYAASSNMGNSQINAGRVTGYSISLASSAYLTTHKLTVDDTITVGCAAKFPLFPGSGDGAVISLYDGGTLGMSVRILPSGELGVYRGATKIAETSSLSLATDTWYYLEFQVLCHASTGTYNLKVDNVSVLSDGSVDTQEGANAYHDTVRISAGVAALVVDDFYICDSTGAVNTGFLGPCRVIAINPDADEDVNWSTVYPALTDHYADVDDGTLCDDDTTYVEDSTTGHRDVFSYANATIVTSIYGLSINTTCRVTDANAIDLKTVVVSGANETTVTETISATDYLTASAISETDPNTSSAWDVSDINSAFFGIEVG